MNTRPLDDMLDALYEDDDVDFANLELADEIVNAYPTRAEAWAARARVHSKLEDFAAAEADTQQALKIDPQSPDALRMKAMCLIDIQKDMGASKRLLDDVLRNHPTHYGALLGSGWIAGESGDALTAMKFFARAHGARPEYLRPLNNLAFFASEHAEWDALVSAVRDIEAQHPLNGLQHYNVGTILFEAGRHSDAITHFDLARQLPGEQNAIQHNRALCLEKLERKQEAIEEWSNLLLREPDWDWPLAGRARCLRALGRTDEALADIGRLNQIDPHNETARRYESGIYFDKNDYAKSLLVLDGLVADGLADAWVHNLRGCCHHQLNDLGRARADFLKVMETEPEHFRANLNLAQTEFDDEKFQRACDHAEAAIAIAPQEWESHHLRAKSLAALKQFDAANSVFDRWLTAQPDDDQAREAWAKYLQAQGEWKAAINQFEQLIQRGEKHPYIFWCVGECYKALDDRAGAAQWYGKARAGYLLQNKQDSVAACDHSLNELGAKKGFFSKLFG